MQRFQIIWNNKDRKNHEITGDAANKAPKDITTIAKECGYIGRYVYILRMPCKILEVISRLFLLMREIRRCPKGSTILLQYPCFNEKIFPIVRLFLYNRILITVVHDLNSVREGGRISKAEISSLSVFKTIIVHSPEMRTYLSKYLPVNVQYHVLNCFPYLTESECISPFFSNEVCFAGNIDKSVFLNKFISVIKSIRLKLYGKMDNKMYMNDNVEYCGIFSPDDISSLKGSWGLVWDGDSLDSCSGTWGEYLKIIAPHKFSLYIAAGIPVIVWDKSAMARIVKNRGIGLIVSSLYDLELKLGTVSKAQYTNMLIAVNKLKEEIVGGRYLKSLLSLE